MESLTGLLYSDKYSLYRNAASILGIVVLARLGLRLLCDMCSGFRAFFLSPLGIGRANLLKYGQWAVVTGASEGIGRGYALELAKRGLNIVLMSRSKDKLDRVAKEIEDKYNRECRVIPVDFSAGLDIYSDISDQLSGLDVGVLVNNVGMGYHCGDRLANVPADRLYGMVQVNCQPAVQMTRLVLPTMLDQGGGYVINMSSVLSLFAAPQVSVYSATKIFMKFFSDGLRKEYGHKGITVQTVQPHYVSTALTRHRRINYFVCSPEDYARAAVATIGIQDTTFGCFPHSLLGRYMQSVPTFYLDRNTNKLVDKSRAEILSQQAKRKENYKNK